MLLNTSFKRIFISTQYSTILRNLPLWIKKKKTTKEICTEGLENISSNRCTFYHAQELKVQPPALQRSTMYKFHEHWSGTVMSLLYSSLFLPFSAWNRKRAFYLKKKRGGVIKKATGSSGIVQVQGPRRGWGR